jgi:DEAD/DEAH box helicase domain-containing protein
MTPFETFREKVEDLSCASEVILPKAAESGKWPEGLHSDLLKALQARDYTKPYKHQADTIAAALAHQDVTLVTGTASGKTLAFLVPAFDQMLREPGSTALLIYPTKALAWDQFGSATKLRDAMGASAKTIQINMYDGDTKPYLKKKIRSRGSDLLLTNPDTLHAAILQYHHLWDSFLRNLKYVIIDEVHAYSGYFGSNVALVMRRLRALCKAYGTDPTFIAASATISDAGKHVEALIGKPVKVIDRDTAGSAEKHIYIVDSVDSETPEDGTVELVVEIVQLGLRGIVFTNGRQVAEKLVELARIKLPGAKDKIAAYRAGYTLKDRRDVEKRLKEGNLNVVISTNALELGIDIGDLDICILYGLPSTNTEAWQRLGRVGRNPQRGAVGVVVAAGSVLDYFTSVNTDLFFAGRKKPESVVINPDNIELLRRHLACAAFEAEGKVFDIASFPKDAGTLLTEAKAEFEKDEKTRTYNAVDLRCIRKPYDVYVEGKEQPIGQIDGNAAHREAHWGAVYLQGNERYRVMRWNRSSSRTIAGRIIVKKEEDSKVYTSPDVEINIDIKTQSDAFILGQNDCRLVVVSGVFDVTEQTVGFWNLQDRGNKRWPTRIKFTPPGIRLTSHGICIGLDPETQQSLLGNGPSAGRSVLHSLGHLLVAVLMEEKSFGRSDVFEYADGYCGHVDSPALFLYEAYPHGLGYTSAIFKQPEIFLQKANNRVLLCKCESGCPACLILKGRCVQSNQPLDKSLVLSFLQELLATKFTRNPWAPPLEPPPPARGSNWLVGADYQGCGAVVDIDDDDGVTIRRPSGQIKLLRWQ